MTIHSKSRPHPRIVLMIAAVVGLAVIGAVGGLLLGPVSYQASIAVDVKPNLGGDKINSSTDASAQSVIWTEPGMLASAMSALNGSSRKDDSPLKTMICKPVNGDITMICSITGSSKQRLTALLNHAVRAIIPIESRVLRQSDQLIVEEHVLQQAQTRQKDGVLAANIGKMKALPKGSPGRRLLAFDIATLRINRSILRGNGQVIASLRRQEQNIPKSFVVLGAGSNATAIGQAPWPLLGAAGGLGLGVLASLTLWLGNRRTETPAARRRLKSAYSPNL